MNSLLYIPCSLYPTLSTVIFDIIDMQQGVKQNRPNMLLRLENQKFDAPYFHMINDLPCAIFSIVSNPLPETLTSRYAVFEYECDFALHSYRPASAGVARGTVSVEVLVEEDPSTVSGL